MDEDKDKNKNNGEGEGEVSEEEKKSEAEALAEVKDEELKSKIADDFGINAEDEPELFDKLVEREKSHLKKTSDAIRQKIGYREKLQKTSDKPQNNSGEGESHTDEGKKPLTLEELDQKLDERESKRDLENLNLSEEIEAEVKDLAKVKGISVREAAKLPYIVSSIEEVEKEKRISSATPRRTSRGNYASTNVDPSKPLNPEDFPLDTKKGQKAWAEAKVAKRAHEAQ